MHIVMQLIYFSVGTKFCWKWISNKGICSRWVSVASLVVVTVGFHSNEELLEQIHSQQLAKYSVVNLV